MKRDRLMECVDEFAAEMKKKLRKKRAQGFSGWDNISLSAIIEIKLRQHCERQLNGEHEEVDIANLAMMLWYQNGQERGK